MMIELLILILIIVAIGFIIERCFKAALSILLIALLCFWTTGSGILSSYLIKPLESPYPLLIQPQWSKRNAIVLLGAGTIKPPQTPVMPTILAYPRIYEAARLYQACKKTNQICNIIVSGGDTVGTGVSEAVIYQQSFVALGASNTDIKTESHSMNTFMNAEFTSTLLKNERYDQIYLVTSGYHMKRAQLYFAHFGVNPTPASAEYLAPLISWVPIGYNFAVTDIVLHEYLGIIRYHLYNLLGWNTNPTKPGSL